MTADFKDLLTDVKQTIEQLRTQMSEGQPSDLDVLEPKLTALTSALPGLDIVTGKQYLDELQELDSSLGELKQDFIRQREGAQAGIEQLSTRLKAGTAYAKSVAALPKRDEDEV